MRYLLMDSHPRLPDVLRARALSGFRLRNLFVLAVALAVFFPLTVSAQTGSFTLSNNGPITVPSQQYAPVTVTVTAVNGFSGQVTFSCSNLPVYATCNFPNANTSVNVSGSSATETIVINTSQINNYQSRSIPQHAKLGRAAIGMLFAPAACLLLARKRGIKLAGTARMLLCVLALYPLAGLAGCAAVKPNATPAGTYNFIVAGAQNSITAVTTVTLHVT